MTKTTHTRTTHMAERGAEINALGSSGLFVARQVALVQRIQQLLPQVRRHSLDIQCSEKSFPALQSTKPHRTGPRFTCMPRSRGTAHRDKSTDCTTSAVRNTEKPLAQRHLGVYLGDGEELAHPRLSTARQADIRRCAEVCEMFMRSRRPVGVVPSQGQGHWDLLARPIVFQRIHLSKARNDRMTFRSFATTPKFNTHAKELVWYELILADNHCIKIPQVPDFSWSRGQSDIGIERL